MLHAETGLTPNLVRDGGMEVWREVRPEEAQYNSLKKLQVSFDGANNILMPSAYEQGGISVVQREEKDVCSGKYSLRLKAESFYMHFAFEGAYAVRRGDFYVTRFMAKGKGSATVYLTVYGDGTAYTLEQKGTPVPDKWTLIEQRILVGGASPDRIYPRLSVSGDLLIDDVFVGRVLREDEAVQAMSVPKEYDERIVFASAAAAALVIDGKLDEACWNAAVPFSGFRLSQEQTLLAPEQAAFRVLYDTSALYLGIEIKLPDAPRIQEELKAVPSKEDKNADVYSAQHSVEIFIQPPGQSRYIQCVVSLDGCRYDGVALDNSWNGQWTYGIGTEKDRWFLEMRIPAADLKLDTIASGEGWRLNVVDNKNGNYSTWAAVGNNFHNPFAFGTLITKDFPQWRQDKLQAWGGMRKKALDQAGKPGLLFADRLERAANFTQTLPAIAAGEKLDWQNVTRGYALINFIDAVYRTMDAEMMYAEFFQQRK